MSGVSFPRPASTLIAVTMLLLAWGGAVGAAATVSTLTLLPGDAAIAPAAGNQTTPAIATGGQGSLVVWADDRSSATNSATYPSGSRIDIYAARLDANGQLLDPIPIVVAENAAEQTQPRVAWNGQDYLVVWTTQLPTEFYYSYGIEAARVSTIPPQRRNPRQVAIVQGAHERAPGGLPVAPRGAREPPRATRRSAVERLESGGRLVAACGPS